MPLRPLLTRAADVACELDQRLVAVIDVDHAAIGGEPETYRGLLLAHAVELERVVGNNLDGRIDLLDLDQGGHRPAFGSEKIVDIDRVFAGHDAANADGLLAERTRNFPAIDRDRVIGAAAVVAIEHHEAGLAHVIPYDIAERVLGI